MDEIAKGIINTNMTHQEIADALLVSRSTINRWATGKNLPHRAMRKPILEWLASH